MNYRSTRNKKASLAISTNAIVVLIVAVIMLGLIIGLVTRGFDAVEQQFLSQIEDSEAEPANPSSSQPITASRYSDTMGTAELGGFKVKIRNTLDSVTTLRPQLDCSQGGSEAHINHGNEQAIPVEIQPGDFEEFTYIYETLATAGEGLRLCQLKAVTGSSGSEGTDSGIKATDFQLTIE